MIVSKTSIVIVVVLLVAKVGSFGFIQYKAIQTSHALLSSEESTDTLQSTKINPKISAGFKILTCSSSSCSKCRKDLNLDEYATFSAFWERIQKYAPNVRVEECPCLGSCKNSPCVAVEHDDYVGPVALIGMDESEFSERVFHGVVSENDVDRVWWCLQKAIDHMVENENNCSEDSGYV